MVKIAIPSPRLSIHLLGGFSLSYDDRTIDAFAATRLQSLLAYLLIHRDAPQSRQQIAFHFWPVSSESQARTNLRKLLLQLRRALPDADTYLSFDNQLIQWQADAPFTCDVIEVQQLLKQLRENPLNQDALTALFDLYRGELLPSCYDDWIAPLREGLHHDVMAALEQMVTLLENQRAYDQGIRYAQRLLTFDPLEEKSYQRLMRLRAADGDRAGALKVYQECTAILERELGVEPSAETAALYERLRQAKSTHAALRAKPQAKPALPPLVGRQAEWQTLRKAWQQAVRGHVRFVTIAGEAGIGKTRLAEELLLWAEEQGIAAVRTRSYQAQGALAYAPITELLQAESIYRRVQLLNENRLTQIARLLPKLLEEYPDLPSPQPMTESWQRQQFFDALAHAILADGQPLVLLFDDLQWADGETLTWLHFLLRAAVDAPLLLVGTIRTGEIESDHPLPTLLNSLRRDDLLTGITLAPLNSEEVQALAQSLQNSALADDQLAQLYADTEGNPLFVVESVRAQQDAEEAQGAGLGQSGLPPKIYSVIRSRLTQLSPETQTLVNLAAVIGRSFTYDVLMQAGSMAEAEVVDSLDELLERQIIREQTMAVYDFSHDRIREVAYNEISRTRRRLLHRRVAEVLETRQANSASGAQAATLAHHYMEAGNCTQAIHYLLLAGDEARQLYANAEAEHFYQRAIPLLQEQAEHEQTAHTLMKLGLIYTTTFDFANAQRMYEEAFALWQPTVQQSDSQDSPAAAILRIAIGEPLTLNPALAYDSDSAFLLEQLFEGLVEIDSDQNVVPALAMRWDVLENGTKYLFTLRSDARWNDGSPVTASHVELAWKRNLSPALDAPAAHLLYDIRNARAYHRGELTDPSLIGVRALNDTTLEISLEGQRAYFPYLLAHPITYPVSDKFLAEPALTRDGIAAPMTNGPFALTAWQPGAIITLERNPFYTGRFSGNVQRVEGTIFSQWAKSLAAYANTTIDLLDISVAPPQIIHDSQRDHADDLVHTPLYHTNYLVFRVDCPPFDDPRIRKAFIHAVNRVALGAKLAQHSQAPALGGIVPPGLPGHSPEIGLPYAPLLAKRLLAEAGYGNGTSGVENFPDVHFLHTHGLGDDSQIRFLQRAWQQHLGLTIEVTTLSWAAFQRRLTTDPPHLMLSGWLADYPDPDNFLRVLFHSKEGQNEPRWQNAKFDDSAGTAARESNAEQRIALYQELDRLLVNQEAVVMPLSYGKGSLLMKPWVRHYRYGRAYSRYLKKLIVQ
ncbi:MAG: ABC transporter substrate-binding protein [Caldilineaceae bacterium]